MRIQYIKGCGSIRLVKVSEFCIMRLPDGKLKKCIVEHRKDPLTGLWCRINVERALREHRPDLREIEETLANIATKSADKCPFCEARVERCTPRFYLLPEGKLSHGNVMIVPNMYPFGKFHSIAILDTTRHFRYPWDLHDVILDLLILCQDYFDKVTRVDSSQRYHYVNMNFLFPAGASAVHPHAQIIASSRPTNIHKLILSNAKKYYRATGRKLLIDYADTEVTLRDRLILVRHDFIAYVPFAPHVNYEMHIVNKYHNSLQDLSFSDLRLLSKILCNIIATVNSVFNQFSFNFAIYSVMSGSALSEHNILLIRLGFRKEPCLAYVNDIGFMELLHGEYVIVTYPEEYARKVRLSIPQV